MAIAKTLKALLTQSKVKYRSAKHPAAYTAQEIAASQHVPGKRLAKCVLINTDHGLHLAVLPATRLVDLKRLKKLLKAKTLKLATEKDIKRAFPDVDVGAMSPFGNLYQVPTIVEKTLTECDEIVCNAGSHTDTIALSYRDFQRVATPRVGRFALDVTPSSGTRNGARKRSARRTPKPRVSSARRAKTRPAKRTR